MNSIVYDRADTSRKQYEQGFGEKNGSKAPIEASPKVLYLNHGLKVTVLILL